MYDILTGNWTLSPELERLQTEKKAAVELQKRKHLDWDDNYELYRNKVKTNRLTQRQPVNIPLMKETIKTQMSTLDNEDNVDWKELGGDEQKQLTYQEIWNDFYKQKKVELVNSLDTKNVLLYGISARQLNLTDNGVSVDCLDVYDMAYDPLGKPWDLDSHRFLIRQNIFRTVREILADDRYSAKGKDELKIWKESPAGVLSSSEARKQWELKQERLKALGASSDDYKYFAAGDRIVNLTEHYTNVWNEKKKAYEKRVVVYADDKVELLNETLIDLIGVDFWPFAVWSEDPETNDIYPDSIADLVRTPNKVLNVWYSQLIENRTLKNFQMHWYTPNAGYTPQTYTPGPGMMIPAPPSASGRIDDVIKPVEVSGLDDTLEAINAVVQIVERATGATSIEKGQPEVGQQTLGEVQILVGKAKERTVAMAKFRAMAFYEMACKWDKLMQANPPKTLELFKIGRSGKAYPKKVYREDWTSKAGYEPVIQSGSEAEVESTKEIQKFMFVMGQFPNNPALRKIAQKRELKILNLSPDELRQVEEAEDETQAMAQQQQMNGQDPGAPPVDMAQMEQNIASLSQ